MVVVFVCTYFSGLRFVWEHPNAFPPPLPESTISSLAMLFVSAALLLYNGSTSEPSRPAQRHWGRTPPSLYTFLIMLMAVPCFLEYSRHKTIVFHPIDLLMHDAGEQHQTWASQAATSKTLGQATEEYRKRYLRHPPPEFDKWYDYATARSSVVIDDYDSIYEDLLPFWAIDPQILRKRTREIISDPWNEVAEVSIRSGAAEIGPNVLPTHRWMLDGVLALTHDFSQWLPDMDLAFNINDESRLAVPYKNLEKLRSIGVRAGASEAPKRNQWSLNRAETWHLDETSPSPSRFEDHSFTNNFYSYGSVACRPGSSARNSYIWDPRNLCISCAAPHSLGPFLRNWTLSASPCHQPDLANLHGFYLSPAAFKTAHELVPVFSQSKAHGYADIMYPSPWNYMDKVKYEPSTDDTHPDRPFIEKENTLFWRGATSEGVSAEGTWKGMTRQRLVHLANNVTSGDTIPILLPHGSQPERYVYHYVPASQVPALGLDFDVAIVDKIARCGLQDCPNQEKEFGLVGPSDFQDHWRYRYLFDLDGAGFSGRFLPFLRSRCLPFKTALFREWYDGRITAWKHFVPIDLRLHGVHSTLAYFSGTKIGMAPRIKEGEKIAEEGREWAEKALRKGDMEIYMFRLLLEWGRLTDDRRDEIGFQM